MPNPVLYREIAFNGKLRSDVDGASIGPNDFQVLKNLRYTYANVRGVQGHTKINSVAAPQTAIRNGIHFRKDQPSESHVLIDANLNCYQLTAAIPGTGLFNVTAIYTDSAGATVGRYAVAPDGMLCRCTGKEALLWGGTEYDGVTFIDNPATGQFYDYTDQVRQNSLTDSINLATIHTALSGVSGVSGVTATWYAGSPMPADGFKYYIATGTGQTGGLVGKYWNGSAWAGVPSPVDGTSGLQTAGNRSFTFDSTESLSKQYQLEKVLAHWYQFTLTAASGDFGGVPKISRVTTSIPMQKTQDLFDGEGRTCAAFILNTDGNANSNYDFTSNVFSSYYDSEAGATFPNYLSFIDIQGTVLAAAGYMLFGFPERISGLMVYLAGNTVNTAAATIDLLDYWNGSAWVNLKDSMVDGTLDSTAAKTFSKSGWITWTPPDENLEMAQTGLPGHQEIVPPGGTTPTEITKEFPLYYYRMSFSATLAACRLYHVKGIPAQSQVRGYTFADQYAGRLMLCDNVDGARNSVRYTSYNTSNVLNGQDSGTLFFGGDEAVVSSCALYNRYGSTETNTWVICKRGETWALSGDDPSKWTKFQVSDKIGCVAPRSMVPINLSPKDNSQQVSYNAAVWVSSRGVEVFSGGSIVPVSDDISDLFDPCKSTYLGAAAIATITAFYDPTLSEYHMIVPGSAEYVWDTRRGKWFQIVRGTELYGGFPVTDSNGYKYCYGYNNAGFLMRLENGTAFDTTAIAHTLRVGDMAFPEGSIREKSRVNWFDFIFKAKTVTDQNVATSYYEDTATAATTSKTVSPINASHRLVNTVVHGKGTQSTFHGFEATISTDDETTGLEPLYLGINYTVYPRELK